MYEEQRHGYAVKTTSYATRDRSKHSHRWMDFEQLSVVHPFYGVGHR